MLSMNLTPRLLDFSESKKHDYISVDEILLNGHSAVRVSTNFGSADKLFCF